MEGSMDVMQKSKNQLVVANDVYLYTVDVEFNKQELEKRETAADKFIQNGFGKMYLMR